VNQITSLFVHKVIAEADESLCRRAIPEGIGLDLDVPAESSVMLADTEYAVGVYDNRAAWPRQ